jgi:hypothetical protein
MTLTPDVLTAADAIISILDELQNTHPGADVIWLAQALAAYVVSGDGEIGRAESGAQHVHMRRAIDEFLLDPRRAHGIDEILTEILVNQGQTLT